MGKGKKTCKSCGHVTGPRSFTCPSCKASFDMKLSAKKKKVVTATKTKTNDSPKVSKVPATFTPRKRYIFIPAGECPVTLKDLTEEGVIKWREAIISKTPSHIIYQPSAYKYWLRDFVPIFSELYLDLSFVL